MTDSAESERRSAALEVRAKGRRLEGYAAVFDTEARIGSFVEKIQRGAFAASLAGDVIALADHDPARVLARTRSGTLRLAEDTKGLSFDFAVPDTSHGRDLLILAERGDIGGASIGFIIPDGGDVWDGDKRTLTKIDLKEISIVSSWPAYPDTTVVARSRPRSTDFRLTLARRYLETLR
jgi:HK97 family phage prohead protease